MLLPIDVSLLFALVGIILVVLFPLVSFEDKSPLLKWARGIDKDLRKLNEPLLDKAQQYSCGRSVNERKLIVRRLRGDFPEDKPAPRFVIAVACIAFLSMSYCLVWGVASFVYSVEKNPSIIDCILIAGQFSVFIGCVAYWYGKTFETGYPTLYIGFFFVVWLVGILFGLLAAFTGVFFHVINAEWVKWFYIGTVAIPLVPIIIALFALLRYYFQERRKYDKLNKAVQDYEQSMKEEV